MHCTYHSDREATALCQCGRMLCPDCAAYYETPLCKECARKQLVADFVRKALVPLLVALFSVFLLLQRQSEAFVIVCAVIGMEKLWHSLPSVSGLLIIVFAPFFLMAGALIGPFLVVGRTVPAVYNVVKTVRMARKLAESEHTVYATGQGALAS